jgi:hypothetical protein
MTALLTVVGLIALAASLILVAGALAALVIAERRQRRRGTFARP